MENVLHYIVRQTIRRIIIEDKEGENMKRARFAIKKYCKNVQSDDDVWDELNMIRTDIPYSRIYEGKYLEGVVRLVCNEELEKDQMDEINNILEVFSNNTDLANKYDGDFNGLFYEELCFELYDEIVKFVALEKDSLNGINYESSDYEIVPIPTFEEAQRFSPYTDWCITKSKFDFETYTSNGKSFYFCYTKDFVNMEKPDTANTPCDSYGLSLIAVSVFKNRMLATSTTRWNEGSVGNKTLSIKQISELIGKNFFDVFVPLG